MVESISSTSSFISSCLGLDSAQRAWNHYKKSEYKACLQEVAYAVGTLSCVVSLGALAYVCLSSEAEKARNQEASIPLKERTKEIASDFLDIYEIFLSILQIGFNANKASKVKFSEDVKIRHFFVEMVESAQWSHKAQQLVTKLRLCPIEKVSRRYVIDNQFFTRLRG